ncbi:MAG: hypothetical protein LC802_05470 [Acidobacteria bacterium]|nr:hypothetical protein [Acidobacteriota bacterium]
MEEPPARYGSRYCSAPLQRLGGASPFSIILMAAAAAISEGSCVSQRRSASGAVLDLLIHKRRYYSSEKFKVVLAHPKKK